MTELVINAPHLQSTGQRISTVILSFSGWLLWGYCLLPLLILCGWWLGIHICAFWVNLCGGYLGLQKLMFLYLCTVAGSAAGWAAWILYNQLRHPGVHEVRQNPTVVTSREMSEYFKQSEAVIETCRSSSITTVEFDASGRIIGLIAHST
ncbi:MAG: poly-beta-1,6-N-acetyl-D-glucosamine biosynthesis protein PgaD [Methylococcaceae bacterium]